MSRNKKIFPWHVVEKKISEEMKWLRTVIQTSPFNSDASAPISCPDCLLRKIAVLIISGKVYAKEIRKSPLLESFWVNKSKHPKQKKRPKITHGADWHANTMKKIENHFLYQKCEVEREPNLYWGRSDLGVYKSGTENLYIEVGTTSLFKLLINLNMMRNCMYLIVPDNQKLIEFTLPKELPVSPI